MRKLVTLNWKSKLLLGSVSLGLTVVAISSLTTHNTTKTVVRSITTFNPKTSLEPQTLGSRFWGPFIRWLGRKFSRQAIKRSFKTAGHRFKQGFQDGLEFRSYEEAVKRIWDPFGLWDQDEDGYEGWY